MKYLKWSVIMVMFPVSIFAAQTDPADFLKEHSGISWWIVVCLIGAITVLLRLIWWLCVRAFDDMKKTNQQTIEELKQNNSSQLTRLEHSIDKLDKTISKAFSRMDEFEDDLHAANVKISTIEGICFERRKERTVKCS